MEKEMARAVPVRSSHTSTAGMLAWPHPDGAAPSPGRRPNQPTDEFRKVVFGGQVTDEEEAEGLNKRRPCSAPKSKEMTGSGIFEGENAAASPTSSRNSQSNSTVSQINFAEDGSVPPRKPTSVAEVPSQRDLDRTIQGEGDSTIKMQVSDAKSKELGGHDIFADYEDPRPNISRRSNYRSSASHSPVKNANVSTFSFGNANIDSTRKTAKKITSNKSTDLTGDANLVGDSAPASTEKQLSSAKLKEITGSNIFADGKAPTGERAGRTRQPPGGDSTISLV
ncbi:uncharacterized protein LOC133916003 [Phragmites australis]|uniref:uncharacterized protein LOC133916003 n=1 Tax=Phragmites australis TaxID=29695 RepID=UPI002D76C530|nr:uncharacterized protein LOC133916003 [Phragmites australis]